MSQRPLPRSLVLALAALILVAVPAAFVIADDYRLNLAGGVEHRHVGSYDVYDAITGDAELKSGARAAREQWSGRLSRGATLRMPEVESGADIKLRRYNFPPNVNAAMVWDPSEHSDSAAAAEIAFDSAATIDWSVAKTQGKTCRALGYILGLGDPLGPERDDCMEDPLAYTDVKDRSIELVNDFYGPNVGTLSGTLYANRASVGSLDPALGYSLSAAASGHALQSIKVFLDADQTPVAQRTQAPWSLTWSVAPNQITSGRHTVRTVATNAFGQSETSSFEVVACSKFVSSAGSDANPGTRAAPYASVGRLLQPTNGLQAGQVGCFLPSSNAYSFVSASVMAPGVTLRPYDYDGSEATLRGSLRVHPSGTGTTIEGFTLDGRSTETDQGPEIYATGVILRENEITNHNTNICVQIGRYYNGPRPVGVVIERNLIHDCGVFPDPDDPPSPDNGIYVSGALQTEIRDNWIYDNPTAASSSTPTPTAPWSRATSSTATDRG